MRTALNLPPRLSLARLPTPIERLNGISRRLGKDIYIWRDDLTGFLESGNKARKLEFLVADALSQGADTLVTCGGPQSNHARATAAVARKLGLEVSLLLRKPKNPLSFDPKAVPSANLLLDSLLGADIEFIEYSDYLSRGARYDTFLEEKAERLKAKGRKPYLIAEGGSCPLGAFGYFAAAAEMVESWQRVGDRSKAPDSLFMALGSGGTYAGLHLGLEALGYPSTLVHAVNVCDDAGYFTRRIHGLFDSIEERYGLRAKARALQIHDGHVGLGYAEATDEELRRYAELLRSDGILLDPCYTGKAFLGMLREIEKAPSRFGRTVLFLHSGGLFGTFHYAAQYVRSLNLNTDPTQKV